MLMTLGIFTMLLAAVTKPLWWDHAKHLLGKDEPAAVDTAAKK
jgi:hypothetical protein